MVNEAVNEYLDYATIHGLGRSKNSPFLVLKVLWIVGLCASLGVIMWQVSELYKKFDSVPVSTSIELTTASHLTFPTITICNKNAIKFDALTTDSLLGEILIQASEKNGVDLGIYTADVEDFFDFNYTAFDAANYGKDIDEDILWYTGEQFKMAMGSMTDEELWNISQPLNDFVLLCHFAGVSCKRDSFGWVRSYDYGLCHYFEATESSVGIVDGKVSGTGPEYALELLLNIGEADSLPFVTSASGIVLNIDHKDGPAVIFDRTEEIFIPTGFEASIALTQTDLDRVPGKTNPKRCSEDSLSLTECKRSCYGDYIYRQCGCIPQYYDMIQNNGTFMYVQEGFQPCHTDEHFNCTNTIMKEFLTSTPNSCGKYCLSPCKQSTFEKETAMFTWPSDRYLPVLRRILQARYPGWNSTTTTRDFIRGNLAMVRIYLKTLTYQTLKEEYSYTTVNFISDIGGQLGLWAGFSVLSVLEIVELLLILCANAKRGRKKTGVEPLH